MNKRIRKNVILAGLIVLILIFALFTTIAVNTRNTVKKGTDDKSQDMKKEALSLVPDDVDQLIYLKNFNKAKSLLEGMEFYKVLINNPVYLDFKIKLSMDWKIFFFRMNFNLDRLIKSINGDLALGKTSDGDYFLAAGVNLKTQLLYTILNLLPEIQVSERDYKNQKYYHFVKNSKNIYYSLLGNCFVLTGQKYVIEEIIDASGGGTPAKITPDILKTAAEDTLVYYQKKGLSHNKYFLLPDFTELLIAWNLNSKRLNLYADPGNNFNLEAINYVKNNYTYLKVLPFNCMFCYNNNRYELQKVIEDLVSIDSQSEFEALENDLTLVEDLKDNAVIVVNRLIVNNSNIQPEMAVIVEYRDNFELKNKVRSVEKVKKLLSHITGVEKWESRKGSNYTFYKGSSGDFAFIDYEKMLIFTVGSGFNNEIISILEKNKPTLYDKYYQKLSVGSNTGLYYAFLNPDLFARNIEPIFKKYIREKLDLAKSEYNDSFGKLLAYFYDKKPLFMDLTYSSKDGKYSGKAVVVE